MVRYRIDDVPFFLGLFFSFANRRPLLSSTYLRDKFQLDCLMIWRSLHWGFLGGLVGYCTGLLSFFSFHSIESRKQEGFLAEGGRGK